MIHFKTWMNLPTARGGSTTHVSGACSVQEYANGDDEVPICVDTDDNSQDMLQLQEPANKTVKR